MNLKRIVTYGIIAAIYTVLSLLLGGLSFGSTQIRIGELLMILCIFDKEYILPLTFACFVTNLFGIIMGINVIPLDLVFGTIATLLSAYLMNLVGKKNYVIALLIPAIVNGIIIGSELAIVLGLNNLLLFIVTVFIGEFISVFVLGLILYKPLQRLANYIKTLE